MPQTDSGFGGTVPDPGTCVPVTRLSPYEPVCQLSCSCFSLSFHPGASDRSDFGGPRSSKESCAGGRHKGPCCVPELNYTPATFTPGHHHHLYLMPSGSTIPATFIPMCSCSTPPRIASLRWDLCTAVMNDKSGSNPC